MRKSIILLLVIIFSITNFYANEKSFNNNIEKINFFDFKENKKDSLESINNLMKQLIITGNVFTGFGIAFAVITPLTPLIFLISGTEPIIISFIYLLPFSLAFFGYFLITGLCLSANAKKFLNHGEIYPEMIKIRNAGIIVTSICAPFSIFGLVGITLAISGVFKSLDFSTYFSLIFSAAWSLTTMLPLFFCGLPLLTIGLIFTNIQDRIKNISYMDYDKGLLVSGFAINF